MARPQTNLGMIAMGMPTGSASTGYRGIGTSSVGTNEYGRPVITAGNPENSAYADELRSALLQANYNQYLSTFRPIEDQLYNDLLDPDSMQRSVDKARSYGMAAYDSMRGSNRRRLNRYGLTEREDPNESLNRATSRVAVENMTRQQWMDRKMNLTFGGANISNAQLQGLNS